MDEGKASPIILCRGTSCHDLSIWLLLKNKEKRRERDNCLTIPVCPPSTPRMEVTSLSAWSRLESLSIRQISVLDVSPKEQHKAPSHIYQYRLLTKALFLSSTVSDQRSGSGIWGSCLLSISWRSRSIKASS